MLTLLYQSDSKRIKTFFSRILGKSEIVFNLPRPKREKETTECYKYGRVLGNS